MRQVTQTLYKFDELPTEDAKKKALQWAYQVQDEDNPWLAENKNSILAFCAEFGVNLIRWQVSAGSYDYDLPTLKNETFRRLKLKNFKRDNMPTGYYLDCALWETFHDEWKRTGDPKSAFESAVHAGFKGWADDWEDTLSEENLTDFLTANEYEFTEDGEIA